MVVLGRIAGVYGVRGWLRIESWTRPVENLLQYRYWQLSGTVPRQLEMLTGRPHGRGLVARVAGPDGVPLDDPGDAAALVGALIEVERDALPSAPAGSYYWTDLIGLEVRSVAGERLGCVESLSDNGAHDVMTVRHGERELLIPFVTGPVVQSVDMDAGRVVVDWSADF